jgi:hypothetical protein
MHTLIRGMWVVCFISAEEAQHRNRCFIIHSHYRIYDHFYILTVFCKHMYKQTLLQVRPPTKFRHKRKTESYKYS